MNESKIDCYTIKTEWTPAGKIMQTMDYELGDIRGQLIHQVLDTKEAQLRDALIALGWAPPKEKL